MKKLSIRTRTNKAGSRLYLSVRFDNTVPTTAAIKVRFTGMNADGSQVNKAYQLNEVKKVWSDRLEGWLTLSKAVKDYYTDDFSISSNISLSVSVTVEGDSDPEVRLSSIADDNQEFTQNTASQSYYRLWRDITVNNSILTGRDIWVSAAIPDVTNLLLLSVEVSNLNLFPHIIEPKPITNEAFQELLTGELSNANNGNVYLVSSQEGSKLEAKILFSNAARNYSETFPLEDLYTLTTLSGSQAFNITDSNDVTIIANDTPAPAYPPKTYNDHPTAASLGVEYFQTEINNELIGEQTLPTEILLPTWLNNRLDRSNKHNIAKNIGYTITSVTS